MYTNRTTPRAWLWILSWVIYWRNIVSYLPLIIEGRIGSALTCLQAWTTRCKNLKCSAPQFRVNPNKRNLSAQKWLHHFELVAYTELVESASRSGIHLKTESFMISCHDFDRTDRDRRKSYVQQRRIQYVHSHCTYSIKCQDCKSARTQAIERIIKGARILLTKKIIWSPFRSYLW